MSSGKTISSDKDDTHWIKVVSNDRGISTMVGKNDGSGKHCNSHRNYDGSIHVKHRGECKVCDDERGSSDSGGGK